MTSPSLARMLPLASTISPTVTRRVLVGEEIDRHAPRVVVDDESLFLEIRHVAALFVRRR